jgi:diacylglycerol O-acyltransferase / wax synthase
MSTPENPMVIGALLLFRTGLTLAALEDMVRSKLISRRRFRQHVVGSGHRFGRPSWRDDVTFDIRDHVRRLDPLEAPMANAELVRLVSDRMSTPLPPDRSPWSFELVSRIAPAGSALLVRIHHCIADGRALVSLFQDLASGLGKERVVAVPLARASSADRKGHLLSRLAGLLRFLTFSRDRGGFSRPALDGRKRVAWSTSIPMEAVKSIARANEDHVAEVLLAGVAGALDRYFRKHEGAPRFVRALLPVAAPVSSEGLGNHYASIFVRLPIAAAGPRARLESIARDMAAVRRGGMVRLMSAVMKLIGAATPALERWAVRWGARRASLVVSSLAGPTAAACLEGTEVNTIVVWAPAAASVGISLTFFGYAGTLNLGVLADTAVVEDPDELVTCFQDAFDELRGGALPGGQ